MKKETKRCLLWIGIGVIWIVVVAIAAFLISIVGG